MGALSAPRFVAQKYTLGVIMKKRLPTEAEHYRVHALVRIMKYCAREIAVIASDTLPANVSDAFASSLSGPLTRVLGKIQEPFDNWAASHQNRIPLADWAMHYSHDLGHSPNAEGLRAAIENTIELCAASVKSGEWARRA